VDGDCRLANTITRIISALLEARDCLDTDRVQIYARRITAELDTHSSLLRSRSQDGLVRLCHGDLHLKNIVIHDGRPTLIDAIEFDDRIATIDVLYDLAFLLMDLWHRDLRAHANLCFSSYVSQAVPTEALGGLAALPLFLSVRAAIRAMVAIDKLAVTTGKNRPLDLVEIDEYVALALHFLDSRQPVLIAIGGLSGTGKTTVSSALAPDIGGAPGALHLRSDVERKRLAGVSPLVRLPREAYSKSASDKVYRRLCDRAEGALLAGHSVIVDAVFQQDVERRRIEQVASSAHAPFFGIWLEAPEHQLIQRVSCRQQDASDADSAVVQQQIARKTTVARWAHVDASGDPNAVAVRVQSALRNRLGES